jgi:hypothetical protein
MGAGWAIESAGVDPELRKTFPACWHANQGSRCRLDGDQIIIAQWTPRTGVQRSMRTVARSLPILPRWTATRAGLCRHAESMRI